MALAMTMDMAGYPVAPLGKRKWYGKGARQSKPRYNKDTDKVVKESQSQGLGVLQKESRLKRRKFFAKRRIPKTVPRAPYNDSSFIMRVRRSGGLESHVALTPTSFMSTSKDSSYKLDAYEEFVDHADYGYGSMTGLIRLRATEDGARSSGCSTIENFGSSDDNMCVEHPSVPPADDSAEQMEQRLDRGVSRFEMAHPSSQEFVELRVARQDSHMQYLEDENLVLKDRLCLIQQEVNELRQRLQEGQSCINVDESDESDD